MVSKARLDLPEPDRPVSTVSVSRGISTSTFLRLCSRAPRMEMFFSIECRNLRQTRTVAGESHTRNRVPVMIHWVCRRAPATGLSGDGTASIQALESVGTLQERKRKAKLSAVADRNLAAAVGRGGRSAHALGVAEDV